MSQTQSNTSPLVLTGPRGVGEEWQTPGKQKGTDRTDARARSFCSRGKTNFAPLPLAFVHLGALTKLILSHSLWGVEGGRTDGRKCPETNNATIWF